ncbi:MAG: anti-sigma factor antagonist [Oscillospiraceae bacterium]|nr:anti-sigma factor antagonist [Oscillospiraceae bacterium]
MTKAEFLHDKSKLTVFLYGEIDHHGARQVRGQIDSRVLKLMPEIVIINFSNVTFMDSSGIGLVLARYKFCSDCGASLYVEGVDRQTGKILALAGIKTIQNINN